MPSLQSVMFGLWSLPVYPGYTYNVVFSCCVMYTLHVHLNIYTRLLVDCISGGRIFVWSVKCLELHQKLGTVLGRNGFSCFYPSPPNEGAGANGFYCEFVTSMWFWSKWRVPYPLQHNHIPIVVFGLSGPWSNRPKGLIPHFWVRFVDTGVYWQSYNHTQMTT